MRIALIVNPFASSVDSRRRVQIQRVLAADHELTVIETTKGGHAIRLAHGVGRRDTTPAAASSVESPGAADVVVALGGDGTINETVNGLLGSSTLIAPLPGGSTNVFARSLGYPNDPVDASHVLLDALESDSTVLAGVGMANDRAFLFNLGAGFDAAVVGRVERRGALKRYAGHPLFVAATLATWLSDLDHRQPWFSVALDQSSAESGAESFDAHFCIALNCDPYTYLGNRALTVAPEASLTSPLSIVGLRSLRLHELLPTAIGTMLSSSGVADGGNAFHRSGIHLATLRGYRPFPYQLDGEYFAPVDSLRVGHLPDAIRLVVPTTDAATAVGPAGDTPTSRTNVD